MQVIGALIKEYFHLRDIEIPISHLTFLFGRNGAGKSSILNALHTAWSLHGTLYSPLPDLGSDIAWVARLGRKDAQVLADALTHGGAQFLDLVETGEWEIGPDDDILDQTDGVRMAARALGYDANDEWWTQWEVMQFALEQLLAADISDASPWHAAVCKHLAEEPVLAFHNPARTATLMWERRALSPELLDAWHQLAEESATQDSVLGRAATRIISGSETYVPVLELGEIGHVSYLAPPIPVVMLNADLKLLVFDVEASVGHIFNRLIGVSPGPRVPVELTWAQGDLDPWLEPGADHKSFRARTGLEELVQLIEDAANALLPDFLKVDGRIDLRLANQRLWHHGVHVTPMFQVDGRLREMHELSAGTARWVALSLREACRELSDATRVEITDYDVGTVYAAHPDDHNMDGLVCEIGRVLPLAAVRYEKEHGQGILIADEPELHLHQLAQIDVAKWLARRAREAGLQVIAATHSPYILRTDTSAHWGMVRATSRGPRCDWVPPGLGPLLRDAPSTGMTPGAWLPLVQGILVVEGDHDVKVIENFFGAELDKALVLLLALGGTGNWKAVIESDFLARLKLPIRTIFDNVLSTEGDEPERRLTNEESKARELLAHARRQGSDVDIVAYDEPDIFAALPEASVRRAFPDARFDGWAPLINKFRVAGRSNFKMFALAEMGLSERTVSPIQFLTDVLAKVQKGERPSRSLERAVKTAIASFSADQPLG